MMKCIVDLGRVIQHEYDHLEGKLFIDYLSPLRKRLLKSKLKDIAPWKCSTTLPHKNSCKTVVTLFAVFRL
jgi:hypothetical protein